MTQDEIIEMAKLAGWEMDNSCVLSPQVLWYIYQGQLETFAKLVAAKEREACAKVADQISDKYSLGYYGSEVDAIDEVADAIRARGEA
jgi:hypothetical protein